MLCRLFFLSFYHVRVVCQWVRPGALGVSSVVMSGELVLAEEGGDFGDEVMNAADDAEDDGADGAPDAGEYRR